MGLELIQFSLPPPPLTAPKYTRLYSLEAVCWLTLLSPFSQDTKVTQYRQQSEWPHISKAVFLVYIIMSHNDDLRETLLTVPLLPIRIRPDPDPNSNLDPDTHHCIRSSRDRLSFYAEIQIIFGGQCDWNFYKNLFVRNLKKSGNCCHTKNRPKE